MDFNLKMPWLLLLLTSSTLVPGASGHGRVLQPPSRASLWRRHFRTLPDYDDNGVNCGGFGRQWTRNRGRCGICGDPYDLKQPRPHEIGGKYGQGLIVARYPENSFITTTTELTTSHRGFWEFRLCPDPRINEQSCFARYLLKMKNGETKFYPKESRSYTVTYRLPKGLTCDHCVLQWKYTAGNNWGVCDNGKSMQGCGPQETFGACSDIQIFSNKSSAGKPKPGVSLLERLSTKKPLKMASSSLHSLTRKKVTIKVTQNPFSTLRSSTTKKKVKVGVTPIMTKTKDSRKVSPNMTKKNVWTRVTSTPCSKLRRSMTKNKVLTKVTPNPISALRRYMTRNKVSLRVMPNMTKNNISTKVTPNPFSALRRSVTRNKISLRVTPNMTKKKVLTRLTPNPF